MILTLVGLRSSLDILLEHSPTSYGQRFQPAFPHLTPPVDAHGLREHILRFALSSGTTMSKSTQTVLITGCTSGGIGHALARELGCEFVEASAKNCINVEKAFYDVVRQLRRQRQSPAAPNIKGPTPGKMTPGSALNHNVGMYDANKPPRHYRDKKERRKCVIL